MSDTSESLARLKAIMGWLPEWAKDAYLNCTTFNRIVNAWRNAALEITKTVQRLSQK